MLSDPGASDPPAGGDLEASVRELRRDVRELQGEVRLLKGQLLRVTGIAEPAGAAPARPAAPARVDSPPAAERRGGLLDRRRTGQEMEALVGRYGMTALGALLLLMAAGVLTNWAVQHIRFGAVTRVAIGAMGAAIVAGVGLRLRLRGARSFGNTLLAIALALVHVDAWGAGPSLGVIPNGAALAVAAAASAALAVLAWRTREEPLFVVGVGGAFLSPFVTAGKQSDVVLLLAYGWVVLAAAVIAVRGRPWRYATWLLALAASAYTLSAMAGDWRGASRVVRDAPACFAVLCAVTVLAVGTVPRTLTRIYIWVAALALLARSLRPEHTEDVVVLAALGTIVTYVALRRGGGSRDEWLPTAIGAPLAFLTIAVVPPDWSLSLPAAALAAAWAAAALLAAWDAADLRGAHLLVAGVASGYAIVATSRSLGVGDSTAQLIAIGGLAAHAATFGALARRSADPLRLVAPLLGLVLASAWANELLQARVAYHYVPFLTPASLAALVAVAGWLALARHARAMAPVGPADAPQPGAVLGALAAIAALLWGHEELSRAVGVEIAVFLDVLYFAAAGVGAIVAGRRFTRAAARRAGLALAVYAALKALYQASDLENVWLRIGAYVLVGSFLLGVAFLYRARADTADTIPGVAEIDPAEAASGA